LLETLVVLVLLAAVVGLLFEAISRVGDLRVRLTRFVDQTMTATLAAAWYRQTVVVMLPDFENGPNSFKGNVQGFTGLTLAPLDETAGAPTAFGWRAVRDDNGVSRLQYGNAQGEWRDVMAWQGPTARFSYADRLGDWSDEWPRPLSGGGPLGVVRPVTLPQLPRFVRFDAGRGAEQWSSIVAVVPPAAPPPRAEDVIRAIR
jgi:type II secretory pathway pseudopilin PulG